jgi:transposase
MRRSFDGLAAIAEYVMRRDPLSGHLFVFRGRRGDRVKILYWDRDGYALWYKRLEKGVFRFPPGEGVGREVSGAELACILEGLEWTQARRTKRYARIEAEEIM